MSINTDGGGASNQVNVSVPTFNPTDEQLLKLTRISYSEQGNDIGAAAEMSLILNKYYLSGHTDNDCTSLCNYVRTCGWWHAAANVMDGGSECNHPNPTDDEKQKISAVLKGARTLPLYIDEHDWRGDISYIENGNGSSINENSNYVQHRTVIHNKLGSTYIFYCFPTPESDPFGYTSKDNRTKFGDGVPAGSVNNVGGSSTSSADTGTISGTNLSGLTFTSGKNYERETARTLTGTHPELKTFYRINMSGAQFIKQILAPYCRSKSTNQGAYRLWFSDEASPDGTPGVKLFFKPDQYVQIDHSMSEELLPNIDKTYEFEYGSGPDSSVIEFNPSFNGMVTSVIGGYEVDATTTNAITNDVMRVRYGKYSDEKRPSTGDATYDGLMGSIRIGDSSYSIEEIQNRAANLWYNMAPYGYTAEMTVLGDPMIDVQSLCSVTVLTPIGLPHHSSGVYLIHQVTDSISGGTFNTSMNMVRNAISIGFDDSGGIDISVGTGDTRYIGEASNLMTGTYNNVLGGSGGSATSGNTTTTPQAANSVIQSAVNWALSIANNDSYGYEWGGRGLNSNGYDCSGLITTAYNQAGLSFGFPSTSEMRSVMTSAGFVVHNELLNDCTNAQVGDVYVNESVHTVMYIGNGQIVHADSNRDGSPGDSSGREILVAPWYQNNWTVVLRYGG